MSTSTVSLPKPIIIGSGVLLLLGLFLASGDPGKAERGQLIQAQAETQQRLSALTTRLDDQELQMRQQNEALQLSARRVEAAEENAARLRARIDEIERQLAAQRKVVVAPAAKPAVVAKPVAKAPVKPIAKPVVKR
jgi:small-conductance mechanosensitive channel